MLAGLLSAALSVKTIVPVGDVPAYAIVKIHSAPTGREEGKALPKLLEQIVCVIENPGEMDGAPAKTMGEPPTF